MLLNSLTKYARQVSSVVIRNTAVSPHLVDVFHFTVPLQMARSVGAAASDEFRGFRNRLGLERSPYLLQHANNPVDWFSWGTEAFNKAKEENKPIFLSVGYSTCHWCHVMERESFENEEIGRMLNENFVSIKVDREERPDVDHVYMMFVQATTGGGGWPMSVWLTPDLKPLVGGTYFPPDDRYFGQPGFKTILDKIATMWHETPDKLSAQGQAIVEALTRAVNQRESDGTHLPNCTKAAEKCLMSLTAVYDGRMGGFGSAPKFPQPVNFNFLFQFADWFSRQASRAASDVEAVRAELDQLGNEKSPECDKATNKEAHNSAQKALKMAVHTLRMMARGGVHDHVGQGFHRYSTDREWHVPHFEKMLYDQAQLAASYIDAYQITGEELFANVARDILTYVSRDLSDESGGFYSAQDADSLPTIDSTEKREGAFCVWTQAEILELLDGLMVEGKDELMLTDVFCYHYTIQPDGNVDAYKDPHGELKRQNVLIEKNSVEETAEHFKLTIAELQSALSSGRSRLWERRQLRPKPHLDNKMVTAWNAMMISAYARAGRILADESYIKRALQAAQFVRSKLYESVGGSRRLLRSCYVDPDTNSVTCGKPVIPGFVDDYAFMIRACLDLYEACHDETWLQWAVTLQHVQDALFWDTIHSAYFSTTSDDSTIILRIKPDQDNAEPSANSVAARNLLLLGSLMDSSEYKKRAESIFRVFSKPLELLPISAPELLTALMLYSSPEQQIVICGSLAAPDTQALLRCVNSRYLSHKVLIVQDTDSGSDNKDQRSGYLRSQRESLQVFQQVNERATAYVCDSHTCSLPVNDVSELDRLLTVAPTGLESAARK